MKENRGNKYLIFNLELKLEEVVDDKLEVARRTSVKRAIEKFPQVRKLQSKDQFQRTTSNYRQRIIN